MKKLKLSIITGLLCIINTVFAQSVFTNFNKFNVGLEVRNQPCSVDNITIEGSGIDQIWDFSNLNYIGSMNITNYQNLSLDNVDSLFQNANVVGNSSTGLRVYYQKTDSGNYQVGLFDSSSQSIIQYTNPLYAPYRMVYDSLTVDSFSFLSKSGNFHLSTIGQSAIIPIAFGKLITPTGTFDDVMLFRGETNQETTISENGQVINISTIDYSWYNNLNSFPLFSIDSTISPSGVSVTGQYYTRQNVGLSMLQNDGILFEIYPSPASQQLFLSLKNGEDFSIKKIQISDMLGKTYMLDYSRNNNVYTFDLKKLNDGIYFFSAETNAGFISKRIVVAHY